jgi:hypothetical protein
LFSVLGWGRAYSHTRVDARATGTHCERSSLDELDIPLEGLVTRSLTGTPFALVAHDEECAVLVLAMPGLAICSVVIVS